jgi:hypothetical protein
VFAGEPRALSGPNSRNAHTEKAGQGICPGGAALGKDLLNGPAKQVLLTAFQHSEQPMPEGTALPIRRYSQKSR